MPYPQHKLIDRFPTLSSVGVAVEHFPRYVNTQPRPHSVDVVLMSVILRGRGRHIMGDHTYLERRGSIGITHYGQVHTIVTTPAGMEIYNVYLDLRSRPLPAMPEELRVVLPQILPLHPKLRNQLNRSVHFEVTRPRRYGELLSRIEEEITLRSAGYEQSVTSLLRVFLIDCCRDALSGGIVLSPSDQVEHPSWLERVTNELQRNYARPVSLDDLVEDARVSKGHLCRLFKAYTGRTVFEYLIEQRIQAAMLRLRTSREKVLAIAMEAGFNDIAYFNRTFRRITGQTPRGYRLQAGR